MICPDCSLMLMNHGAESQGDGDIYDVWYCNTCHCAKYHLHASYCECQACGERGAGKASGGTEKYMERVYDEPDSEFFKPY